MNEIVTTGAALQAVALIRPPMTPALVRAIEFGSVTRYTAGADDDPGFLVPCHAPGRAEIAEAKLVVERMDEQPRITADAMRKWLLVIATGVVNAPKAAEIGIPAATIAVVCQYLPAAALCVDSQRMALSKWRFWPAAVDVLDLLGEYARDWLDLRHSLGLIADARPSDRMRVQAEAERPPPTPEELRAVADSVRRAKATLAEFAIPDVPKPEAKPAYLKPEIIEAIRSANPLFVAARAAGATIKAEREAAAAQHSDEPPAPDAESYGASEHRFAWSDPA
jgi:hypothetical protein